MLFGVLNPRCLGFVLPSDSGALSSEAWLVEEDEDMLMGR
jgi:hypothetical protein